MTQSRAETFALAKNEVAGFLAAIEGLSRTTATWKPPEVNATIDAAKVTLAANLNDARRELLAIGTELTSLYEAELP